MSIDVKGHRLFVSALGNNTIEVIDVNEGKRIKTIGGLKEPQASCTCLTMIGSMSQMQKTEASKYSTVLRTHC